MVSERMQIEEAQPWLESSVTPVVQKTTWGSKVNHVDVYQPTTIPEKKNIVHQVIAAVIAACFHIVVGCAMAYSAILIPQLEAPDSDITITASDASWLASVLVLVVPVGALLAGILMEYVGRLNTICISAIPCVLGWVLIATAKNITVLLIGRIITGISSGFGTSPGVVYITEIANPNLRGSLISFCPTLASLGMVIVYAEGAYVHWRTAAWISIIFSVVPAVLVFFCIPESPVWLVARGEVEKAEKSLTWLAGKQTSHAQQQLAVMVKSQDMKAIVATSLGRRLSKFLRPSGFKPLIILCGLFLIQQFSGIYMTLMYAVTYFQDSGSSVDPSLATVLVGSVRCIMSLCNTALMKRFGRRPLCMLSGCGMAFCMVISGFFTLQINSREEKEGSWIPVACMLLYVCTSMIGLLSIPWTMTAELFPTEIRGIAHGLVISVGHIIMFGAVHSYLSLTALFGAHGIQWFFAAVSLLGSLFVWIFLPETHGVELKDFESYFNNNCFYLGSQRKKRAAAELAQEEASKEMLKA